MRTPIAFRRGNRARISAGAAAPQREGSQETAVPDDPSDARIRRLPNSQPVRAPRQPDSTRSRQSAGSGAAYRDRRRPPETLGPKPGIVARLAQTAAERRWEIVFLTKRPKTMGATAQVQSQRWLVSKGFPLPSVYVVQGSRGRIAAALDLNVVIDDRPENCLDVSIESKARAILIWRDDEKAPPAAARRIGIGVVRSVGDGLDVLTTLDKSDASSDPGLLARVRKMLGLKEQTGV